MKNWKNWKNKLEKAAFLVCMHINVLIWIISFLFKFFLHLCIWIYTWKKGDIYWCEYDKNTKSIPKAVLGKWRMCIKYSKWNTIVFVFFIRRINGILELHLNVELVECMRTHKLNKIYLNGHNFIYLDKLSWIHVNNFDDLSHFSVWWKIIHVYFSSNLLILTWFENKHNGIELNFYIR